MVDPDHLAGESYRWVTATLPGRGIKYLCYDKSMINAQAIYRNTLVWDDHSGFTVSPDCVLDSFLRPWYDAGVGYLSLNVYYDRQPWDAALKNIAAVRRRLPDETPYCRLVSTTDEIGQARSAGKMAVAMDIEGMNALDGQLDLVQTYYELGVRHMMIAYNRNNLAGCGCHDEDTGLTDFGAQVIGEMNRVGMVVDCSHAGHRTTMDAMAHSTQPVVFSHTSPRALVDHERNISDEQIRACAATDGVVGISGVNLFLGEQEATATAVARHVAYVAKLTSVRHAGVCLDFDPQADALYRADPGGTVMAGQDKAFWPEGAGYDRPAQTLHVKQLADVAGALMDNGFDNEEVSAILGGNFRRVAEQVWK